MAAEVEYVALTECFKEVEILRELYERLTGTEMDILTIYKDNTAVVSLVRSQQIRNLQYIDFSFHFSKLLVEEGKVKIQWISLGKQIADFLTKPLGQETFEKCKQSCLKSRTIETEGVRGKGKKKKKLEN